MKTTALTLALLDLAGQGQRPPCGDPDSKPLFTSDDRRDLDRAAYLCRRCPISAPCLQEALESKASAGVWAGYDFGTISRPLRRRLLDQLDNEPDPDDTPSLF